MKALVLCVLVVGSAALADSPFDGTWMMRVETATLDKKPWVIQLAKGIWTSDLVAPPVKVRADGTDQPTPGHTGFDAVAVKVTGPSSVEVTTKKSGRVVFVRALSVAADGKSMLQKWRDPSGMQVATGETVYQRLSSGPAGSHAVSGSWQAVKMQNLSGNATTATYKATTGGMTLRFPTGQSYDAKFDGKEYPFVGDAVPGTVSLKRHGDRGFSETYKQSGKVVEIDTMTLSADGKTMKVQWQAPDTGRSGSYEVIKQ